MPTIHDADFDTYIYDSVNIKDEDLDGEMRRVSRDQAYFSRRHGEAVEAKMKAAIQAKVANATARQRARNMVIERNMKVTVADIDALVDSDPIYVAAKEAEAEAEGLATILRGYASSIESKRSMLMSLGAKERAEYKGEARILDRDPMKDDMP